jgi:hypothetical protein
VEKLNEARKSNGVEPEAEEGMEDEVPEVNVSGHARRQREWWKRGVVQTRN